MDEATANHLSFQTSPAGEEKVQSKLSANSLIGKLNKLLFKDDVSTVPGTLLGTA